jgi:large-conductance mechanosensitive channel
MIQAITVFLILAFIIFFIIFVKLGNKVIKEVEQKYKDSYTSNEL